MNLMFSVVNPLTKLLGATRADWLRAHELSINPETVLPFRHPMQLGTLTQIKVRELRLTPKVVVRSYLGFRRVRLDYETSVVIQAIDESFSSHISLAELINGLVARTEAERALVGQLSRLK